MNSRDESGGPLGGFCDKSGCSRVPYEQVGVVKVCSNHVEWAMGDTR